MLSLSLLPREGGGREPQALVPLTLDPRLRGGTGGLSSFNFTGLEWA
jgi:hypothetical protein